MRIWVMNADGSDRVDLSRALVGETWPAWSPDGDRITFQKSPGGRPSEVWVMNADGTGATRLTGDPIGDLSPDW